MRTKDIRTYGKVCEERDDLARQLAEALELLGWVAGNRHDRAASCAFCHGRTVDMGGEKHKPWCRALELEQYRKEEATDG